MSQPDKGIFRAIGLCPFGNGGAVYHQDRQAELARGDQLGLGAPAARILAHHQVNGVILHQPAVPGGGERAAIHDHAVRGQDRRLLGRIDEAQHVMMLRLGSKGRHVHPSQCQKDAAGWPGERVHRFVDVGKARPAVAGGGFPARPGQRQMRNASQPGRLYRMGAHRGGKGMSRVDQMSHAMAAQIVRQSRHAAEATDADWHWLATGCLRPAGITERCRYVARRQQVGKRTGLGRAAQQENIGHV